MGFLRLFLALAVLFSHVPGFANMHGMIASNTAVKVFFGISGFYMALIAMRYDVTHWKGYINFLSSRLFKLMPLYWLCSALMVLFVAGGLVTLAEPYGEWTQAAPSWLQVFHALWTVLLLGQDFARFVMLDPSGAVTWSLYDAPQEAVTGPNLMLMGHTWSLASELYFYMLFGLIAALRWHIVLAIAVVGWAFSRYVALGDMSFDAGATFFPAVFHFFLLGTLMGRLYMSYVAKWKTPSWYIGMAGLGLVYLMVATYSATEVWQGLVGDVKIVLIAALPVIFHVSKDWKLDRAVGELSYPLYVVHLPVVMLLAGTGLLPSVTAGLTVVISLGFAYLWNRFAGERIDSLRHRIFVRGN